MKSTLLAQMRSTHAVLMFVLALFTVVMTEPIHSQTLTVLYSFTGSPDGSDPAAGLRRGPDGSFYGTTVGGGDFGYGTVFKLNSDGQEEVVYSFCAVTNCVGDGSNPFGSVVRDDAGSIYGTTFSAAVGFFGIVFKIDPTGAETVLHSFTGPPNRDGANPGGSLLRDTAGNLYGTTESGGKLCSQAINGCGTIFEIDPQGKETVLHRFTGGTDGGIPTAGLIKDRVGNFFSTTYVGGAFGCGTVFKLGRRGHQETVLYSFNCSNGDGSGPLGGLVMDRNGNFYGTTAFGGTYGQGSIYKVTKAGKETVLHSFAGGMIDGCTPEYETLLLDENGDLYGTTVFCGPLNFGVVFKLDPTGHETILHTFTGGVDGAAPYGGTLIKANGKLYGTTSDGGIANNGIVYKLSPH